MSRAAPDAPYHLDSAHVAAIHRLPSGSRVLEVGCGGGQCRRWFQSKSLEYVGTDICLTRVATWLRVYGGPDLLCDCHFLPFADRGFDLVYSAAVFEHLACPVAAAQEMFRVLKPGGYMMGNCAFLEPWHDGSFFHLSPMGAITMLTQAGFQIESIWPGRGWNAFVAIPAMAFRKPLRFLRHFGSLAHAVYQLQNAALGVARRITGKPSRPDILDRAVIAGAMNWIARRPTTDANSCACGPEMAGTA